MKHIHPFLHTTYNIARILMKIANASGKPYSWHVNFHATQHKAPKTTILCEMPYMMISHVSHWFYGPSGEASKSE